MTVRSLIKDILIKYIESILKDGESIEKYNLNIKIHELLFELLLRTEAIPMVLDMIFRNGFTDLPDEKFSTKSDYENKLEIFKEDIKQRSKSLIMVIELKIDNDWFDSAIDKTLFRKYYHENDNVLNEITNEISNFFISTVNHRNTIFRSIYEDFNQLFKNFNECKKYCELYFRELYEYDLY